MAQTHVRPVCFMATPLGTAALAPRPQGSAETIDVDTLWHKVLAPMVDEPGDEPVRADRSALAALVGAMRGLLAPRP